MVLPGESSEGEAVDGVVTAAARAAVISARLLMTTCEHAAEALIFTAAAAVLLPHYLGVDLAPIPANNIVAGIEKWMS